MRLCPPSAFGGGRAINNSNSLRDRGLNGVVVPATNSALRRARRVYRSGRMTNCQATGLAPVAQALTLPISLGGARANRTRMGDRSCRLVFAKATTARQQRFL